MKPPRRSCSAYVIVQTIAEHGPVTVEEGMQLHKVLGQYPCITKRIYERAVRAGWLIRKGKRFALTSWVAEWYANEVQQQPITNVVPPRVFNAWTPEMDLQKYLAYLRQGFDRRKRGDR